MAIIIATIAFLLCWLWIEITIFISNRLVKANFQNNYNNNFIWYLRGIATILLLITFIYMYFFQKINLEQAIQYCLGIIR
jgi:hypothetical protein